MTPARQDEEPRNRRDMDSTTGKVRLAFDIFNRYGIPPLLVIVGVCAWFGLIDSPFTKMADALTKHVQYDDQHKSDMAQLKASTLVNTWILHRMHCETKKTETDQLACFKDLPDNR